MSPRTRSQLAGAEQCLLEAAAEADELSIQAEQEDAIEFLTEALAGKNLDEDGDDGDNEDEDEEDTNPDEDAKKKARAGDGSARHTMFVKSLATASENVLVKKTRDEYAR